MYNFLKNVQFKNIFFDLKNSFNFFTTVITKWINNNYKEIKRILEDIKGICNAFYFVASYCY